MQERLTVYADSVDKVREWLKDKRGVAKWGSVDMSDMGWSCLTPARSTNGIPHPRPSWKATSEPVAVVEEESQITVLFPKEVYRFPVKVRIGDSGMRVKLTDNSSQRLRKELERMEDRHGKVSYSFDYETQEAVIYSLENQPLEQYTSE